MTENVQRFATRFAAHQGHYSDIQASELQTPEHQIGRFDFAPGEDDDEMPRRSRGGTVRRGIFLLTIISFSWLVYDDPTRVGRWWSTASEMIAPVIDRALDQSDTPTQPIASTEPASSSDIAVASTTPNLSFTTPITTDAMPVTEKPQENATADVEPSKPEAPKVIATLPPVRGVVQPSKDRQKSAPKPDRLKVRAQSVGLHPSLSRVLLAQLSKSDFRNAGYAIRTALAKTADDATFKWPLQRKTGMAMFEVRFVTGAAKECRRYVVTIEKARWLTTALPIEKCGVKRSQVSRAAKR